MKITETKTLIKKLEREFEQGKNAGDQRIVDRVRVILSILHGRSFAEVAVILKISIEAVRIWVRDLLLKGMSLFNFKTSPGRPAKLTNSQKQALKEIISRSPQEAGYSGGCWSYSLLDGIVLPQVY